MEAAETLNLAQLPLIIAGPILRRTESQAVSVWVALQAPARLRIQVLATDGDNVNHRQPILQGFASTVAIGKSIHLALITAQPILDHKSLPNQALVLGQVYAYDLKIYPQMDSETYSESGLTFKLEGDGSIDLVQALRSSLLPTVNISYFAHGLPTFSLPPQDLSDLKILHGSCRKLHNRELDALPIIDQMITESANLANQRPHQLFFTGDQIYGDEVADPFLWGIQQLQPLFFGWTEDLPDDVPVTQASQLQAGKRQFLAESYAGLTAGVQGDQHKTQSHFLRFSEYCLSYLFAWSDCLWQFHFPPAIEVGRTGKAAKLWNQQVKYLNDTARSQMAVRRTLANIPTYMIFDDHDVSDDWNLNQEWCLRVLGKPLGRQVVQNALLSYALFQGWGNTPSQFFANTIGADLLAATENWYKSGGKDAGAIATIQKAIGMPIVDLTTDLPQFQDDDDVWILKRAENTLAWHYRVAAASHEVIVLDTRTQRGYPIHQPTNAPPHLLSPTAFKKQLKPMLQANDGAKSAEYATFIVSPTNVFTLEILDYIQRLGQLQNKTFDMDIGDSWNLESAARLRLMQAICQERQQVIILSGDIHFGAALQIDYWQRPNETATSFPRCETTPDARMIQLVASAICNSEVLPEILQTKIKSLFSERSRYWIGYLGENLEVEVTPGCWRRIGKWIAFMVNPTQRHYWRRKVGWGYRSQWLQRQSARYPVWCQTPDWLKSLQDNNQHFGLLQRLWRWRWLQEGKEVIGLNNIGLVQLDWPKENGISPIVVYDLYWYSPWNPCHIVYSRFQTTLYPD